MTFPRRSGDLGRASVVVLGLAVAIAVAAAGAGHRRAGPLDAQPAAQVTGGAGYWLVASDGGIFSFGDAQFYGSTGDIVLNRPIVGMAPTPTGRGYWLVASDGGIFSFGDAQFYGSTGDIVLNRPIVGMAPTPTGRGYWLVASDGGVFTFGDAPFLGSAGGQALAAPVVSIAATTSGAGYWLVGADGAVQRFGDAAAFGSLAGTPLNRPIVTAARTPAGDGYWMAAGDGGMFAFGSAPFLGSAADLPLTRPIVGMTPSASGAGYWLAGSDGGVFTYGDALFFGSTGDTVLNRPVVGIAATPRVAVDAVPAPAADLAAVLEDQSVTIPVLANDSGLDDGGVTVAVASAPAIGAATVNADRTIRYVPSPDANGLDTFAYRVTDSDGDSGTTQVTVVISPVNDAPGFSLPASPDQTVVQDSGPQTVAGFATGISRGPANEAGQALTFTVSTDNGALFTAAPDIDETTGNLTFQAAPGATGTATVTVTLRDDGGTANGGVDASPARTFTITVLTSNLAPAAVADAYSTDEDTPLTVAAASGVLANDTDADGPPPLTAVLATGPANAAAFTLSADGSFTYTPGANSNGVDTFTYRARDGAAADSALATVTITVAAVNDAPVNSLPAAPTVNEDTVLTLAGAGAISVSDVDGAAGVQVTLTAGNGTLSLAGTAGLSFTVGDGTADAAMTFTGTLATVNAALDGMGFAPTADFAGAASITIVTNDLGNAGTGGALSDTDVLPVTVTQVNDAPSFTKGADQAIDEDAGPQVVVGWATGISAGPPDEAGQVLTFAVTGNTNAALFSVAPAVSPTGTLTYVPAADASGSATVTVRLSDDGGTANGGVDTSAAQTFSITVNAVNDAPVNVLPAAPTVNEDTVLTLSGGGAVSVTDVDAGASAVQVTLTASAGTLTLDGTAGLAFAVGDGSGDATMTFTGPLVAVNAALDGLTYAPAADFAGAASITITTDDLGATGAGGAQTDTDVLAVTVIAVNDAPVNTVPGAQTVNEDTAKVFSAGAGNRISISDVDAGASSVQVTLAAQSGTVTLAGTAGLAFSVGDGTADATMVFTGTLTGLNAALDGLSWTPTADFNSTRGSASLAITTADLGNTGAGGTLTAGPDIVAITVNPVNDAPAAAVQTFGAGAVQANMKRTGVGNLLTGATDPDTGDGGYAAAFTVGTTGATSPAGGTVTFNAATGSFDFDPPPGATGDVTFTYTVCDTGNPGPGLCSGPATATVNVAGPVIWFVNPAALTNGDGRLSSPFNLLSAAAAVDASGHRIFLYSGTAAGGITLNPDEWLIGQGVSGASFDSVLGVTPPTGTITRPAVGGTRPVVQGNVVMATNAQVRGLNVQPASGTPGLSASGVTGLVVGEASVTTTNAVAVNLANADGTFALTSVSASGGANGIVWTRASAATGSLTVAGGTIQATTGDAVSLSNARAVSLSGMTIQNNLGSGINGANVTGFTLASSLVDNNGDDGAADEAGIRFTNLAGTAGITNTTVASSVEDNVRIVNSSGTLSQLTISGSTIRDTDAGTGNNGLLIQADGTAGITADVTTTSFLRNRANGVQVVTNGSGTIDVELGTATPASGGAYTDNNIGVSIAHNSSGTLSFDVRNATFSSPTLVGAASPVNLNLGACATSLMSGTVAGNTITNGNSPTGPGIRAVSNGPVPAAGCPGPAGTMTLGIQGNTISQVGNFGIQVQARDGSSTVNATIRNNTVTLTDPLSLDGIRVDSGAVSTDTTAVCADIAANSSTTIVSQFGIRVRQRFTGTSFALEGYAGSATDAAAVATYLNARNTLVNPAATADFGGAGFGTVGNCPEPA